MIDAMEDFPVGWVAVTLGDLASVSKQKLEPAKDSNIPYLSLEHIEPNSGQILGQGTAADVKSTKAVFQNGDVLYGKLRPYLNKVCIPSFNGICSTDILVFKESPALSNKYLANFLSQQMVVEYATQNSKGINLPRVSFKTLSELTLNLPPIAEQRRIADKVDQLKSLSCTAREALNAVGPLLKQFRQSVLAAAFRGDLTADWRAAQTNLESASELLARIRQGRRSKWETSELAKMNAKGKYASDEKWRMRYQEPEAVDDTELPDLPDGWCWTSIGELAIIDSGEAFKKSEYADAGLRLLQIANVSFGTTLWNEQNYLPLYFAESHTELVLNAGEIVLALNRPIISDRLKVARITLSDLPAILYQRVGRLRPAIDSVADYLFLFVCGPTMLTEVRRRLQGTDQPYLNTSLVPQIAVPLPPLAEQMQIVRFISEQLRSVTSAASCVSDSMNLLNGLDQSILSKAFRGELVPQDPSDEPASELLARIRAAQSAGTLAVERRRPRKVV